MEPKTYSQSGVNVKKAEAFVDRLKGRSKRKDHDRLWKGAGGYASIYPIDDRQAAALTTDGVGTKLLVALEQKRLDTIGIDLVAMCVNDLLCVGAHPHAFLDYYATGALDDHDADQIIQGIIEGCDQAHMLLIGGETAELPDLYANKHFDLAGFAFGMVTRERLLTGEKIAPGQHVISVASSGIHSNGFSLARKILPENHELRSELLIPTLIYTPPVNHILDKFPGLVTGLAHITGGGWRNLLRLNEKVGYHITQCPPVPKVLKELSKSIQPDEMYKTFNMGMGLCVTTGGDPEQIIEVFASNGFSAQVVGRVTDRPNNIVIDDGYNAKSAIVFKE